MAKRKDKRESDELYSQVLQLAVHALSSVPEDFRNYEGDRFLDEIQFELEALASPTLPRSPELPMMKKFRFQLLHRWMLANIAPCRMVDVGGGKGLLSYLFQQSDWHTTVIDPINQPLPTKYKDLTSNKQISIAPEETVTRINAEFQPDFAKDADLLVAMHAHGCNIQMIEAALHYNCGLILLPCCVIHEPILPPAGMPWIEWLVGYVIEKGFMVAPFRLNFKGQNIGIYARPLAQSLT
ncbi:MAG: hypothetical protein IAF02_24545 [Anaerolineae bacterium]|nr:hypothetical protein [Anaerolineae bacterium]